MSSSNVDHHKAHKTVAGHTTGHGKQNSFDHSNAHSVLAKNHTKSDHTAINGHGHKHLDKRNTFQKPKAQKRSIDKHDTIDPDKINHTGISFSFHIDHAVCISISAAPEEVPGENSEATDQDQS